MESHSTMFRRFTIQKGFAIDELKSCKTVEKRTTMIAKGTVDMTKKVR